MKWCSNCLTHYGPLKRYMWNINHNFDFKEERIGRETQRKGNPQYNSEQGLLCDACAKKKGAWQTLGQDDVIVVEIHVSPKLNEEEQQFFDEINSLIEHRQS